MAKYRSCEKYGSQGWKVASNELQKLSLKNIFAVVLRKPYKTLRHLLSHLTP